MAGNQNFSAADGSGSMAARRRLGRILTQIRESKHITQEAAAAYIERVPSTLWKLESGKSGVRIKVKQDILGLCELYGVDDETRDGLVALAQATRVKGWFQPYLDVMPAEFDMYLGYEADATSMRVYETDLVPGLLQTEDYARALTTLPGPDGQPRDTAEVDKRTKLRLERQSVLTRERKPLKLDVILAESLLHRPIGSTQIMTAQLRHITELGQLPNISVRVAPYAAGLHIGIATGPFILLRFPGGEPPVAYVDAFLGGIYFKEDDETDRYDEAFTEISGSALNTQRSRALIEQAAKELTTDG